MKLILPHQDSASAGAVRGGRFFSGEDDKLSVPVRRPDHEGVFDRDPHSFEALERIRGIRFGLEALEPVVVDRPARYESCVLP